MQPTLAIVPSGDANITLAWSVFDMEFVLESNTNLASTNWLVVPQAPMPTNGSATITLPVTSDDLFFRLHKF
jgi:hypothetical protein